MLTLRPVLIGLLTGFILLTIIGCEVSNTMETDANSRTDDPIDGLSDTLTPDEVVSFIGHPFPDSATNLQMAGEAALDTLTIARFDLPEADLQPYLADLGVTAPLTEGYAAAGSASPTSDSDAWWQPPAIGSEGDYRGVYQQIEGKSYNITVVDSGTPDIVTVFLQVFTT